MIGQHNTRREMHLITTLPGYWQSLDPRVIVPQPGKVVKMFQQVIAKLIEKQ